MIFRKTIFVLLVFGIAFDGIAQSQEMPAPPVVVETITLQPVNVPQEFLAQVEAIESVDLQARVSGVLEQVMFEASQPVVEGQPLFQIAPEQYEAAVAVARAGVAQAEAALNNAERTLARNQELTQRQAVSASVLDEVTAAAEIAQANLAAARAQLQLAELDLSYTLIEAPISGQIGRALFSRGNVVGPGSGRYLPGGHFLSNSLRRHPVRSRQRQPDHSGAHRSLPHRPGDHLPVSPELAGHADFGAGHSCFVAGGHRDAVRAWLFRQHDHPYRTGTGHRTGGG